tara:strand:+ start:293 stop:955 length:663 start_codon:yes stop_codon:yes gene_type:complete
MPYSRKQTRKNKNSKYSSKNKKKITAKSKHVPKSSKKPKRLSNGEISFSDYPQFRPNMTPREIFKAGSFGGTYWRPIRSNVTKKSYKNKHKAYPSTWWSGIPNDHLTKPWNDYDPKINKYGVRVGTTLRFWEQKRWINSTHPYGWVQWYCDFYNGKRSPDDARQIDRWTKTAGPKSRFRLALVNRIKRTRSKCNDYDVSPRIRQTLQHWAYKITSRDCSK